MRGVYLAILFLGASGLSRAESFIHGYPGKRSYVAGEDVSFHLSSNLTDVEIEIARIGAETEVVWSKKQIPVGEHAVPKNASSHGCEWPSALAVKIPASWTSGCYEARARSGETVSNRMFFVVRSSHPGRDTKILLQLATNTYRLASLARHAGNKFQRLQYRRVIGII